ncbi:MAG: hypothetical protein QXL67_04965 [Candidatus Bathyarchaeia archaeon]
MIGFIILLTSWSLSYVSLPEGSARGVVIVSYVPLTTEEVNSTFIRIFFYNLLVAAALITLANLIKVKGLPLGYFALLYHWALYGVFLGTNSFMLPSVAKLFPSLNTLFHGSGIYEITSYTILAAATYNIGFSLEYMSQLKEKGFTEFSKNINLSKSERIAVVSALALLFISNYLEAWQIFT